MEQVKKWKEPWKKKEFGARLSKKALKDQSIGAHQRLKMQRAVTQRIRIVCHKELLLPGLFKSFVVKMKLPLRKDEIDERMKAAFPELSWEES